MPFGRPTTIPVKISSDIPLPIPRSVICSPSHMMNAVPVVSVSTQSGYEEQVRDGHHRRAVCVPVSETAIALD